MLSTIRLIFLALAGLAMAGYGVFHSISSYPGPVVMGSFRTALPTILAVAWFALGVLLAIAGSLTLAIAMYRLRLHKPHTNGQLYGHGDSRLPAQIRSRLSSAYRDVDEFEPGAAGFEFDDDPETPVYRGNGRDNGPVDHRPWAQGYR